MYPRDRAAPLAMQARRGGLCRRLARGTVSLPPTRRALLRPLAPVAARPLGTAWGRAASLAGRPPGPASRPRCAQTTAATRPILRAACAEQVSRRRSAMARCYCGLRGPLRHGLLSQAEPSSPDDGQDHHEVFRPEGSLSGRSRVARWRDPQGRREAFLHGEPPVGTWREALGFRTSRSDCQLATQRRT